MLILFIIYLSIEELDFYIFFNDVIAFLNALSVKYTCKDRNINVHNT